jgi:hypothetical protein
MADWENVCVTDSKYVASNSLVRVKAPVWPNDRHVSLEEAFHFAACCKRIGKIATQLGKQSSRDEESAGIEMDVNLGVVSSQQPLVMEAWKSLACCDGMTGAPLGVSVKRGFDSTVAWLCSCLVYGGQTVVDVAEMRMQNNGSPSLDRGPLQIVPSDFDTRPSGYQQQEREGTIHARPIPEVIERLVFYLESGDGVVSKRKFVWNQEMHFSLIISIVFRTLTHLSLFRSLQSRTSSSLFSGFCSTFRDACLQAP